MPNQTSQSVRHRGGFLPVGEDRQREGPHRRAVAGERASHSTGTSCAVREQARHLLAAAAALAGAHAGAGQALDLVLVCGAISEEGGERRAAIRSDRSR